MSLKIGILKEPSYENRVSLLPEQVSFLIKKGVSVYVEKGAGICAFASDNTYQSVGAILENRNAVIEASDLLLSIHAFEDVKNNAVVIGVYQPLYEFARMLNWANKSITAFSLDMIPRTTRAQSMDVLSSQANVAGYKAVLLAAGTYSRYFPMFMTAAGSIAPAKVLILGAGVAGLQAMLLLKDWVPWWKYLTRVLQ
jgi:NAD(P) transhydrogenase subunit alpha